MKKMPFLKCALVLSVAVTPFAHAQFSAGPLVGLQALHQSHEAVLSLIGFSAFLNTNQRLMLSGEYQTFGTSSHLGHEGSTEALTIIEYRSSKRSHHANLGIQYQVPSQVPQPRLLLGLHLGHEWLQQESKIRDIRKDIGMREEYFRDTIKRILISPSLTFLVDWQRFELFVQLRYGYTFKNTSGFRFGSRDDFAQLVAGTHLKFF